MCDKDERLTRTELERLRTVARELETDVEEPGHVGGDVDG
jgi:hypothetical protein